jgi:taurine--2-oxoglutarate transaminase
MENIKEIEKKYVMKSWSFQTGYEPLMIESAKGSHFSDVNGKEYLDFSAQLMCTNIGHSNPAVVEAMYNQAKKVSYSSPGFGAEARARLAEKVASVAGNNFRKTFFSTSGTEANEAAVKAAKWYTGKFKILSRYRSYHGSTAVSMMLTGDPRRLPAEPGYPGIVHIPDCYCYRCPFKKEYPGCDVLCARYVGDLIDMEGSVAGLVVEPVVGSNGILVPPKEYMKVLREICDEKNVALVADEVMAGFGRCGKWFAMQLFDVEPDIYTMAKGLTSGYVPLGATTFSNAISDFFNDHMFTHGHTYAGHTLACAVGLASFDIYNKENLIEGAAEKGKYLMKRLAELKDHKSVGDVRGVGLFAGIELVKNKKTKEPAAGRETKLSREPTIPAKVVSEAMKNGVYIVQMITTLIIAPPLVITKEEIDEGVNVLDKALSIADAACVE